MATRPFRYDLNQIPYDYTVEVRNRFKGLDQINRVLDELWTGAHDIVQETGIKTIPMEKKCKNAKWLSGEALQIAVKTVEEIKKAAERSKVFVDKTFSKENIKKAENAFTDLVADILTNINNLK